MPDLIDCLPDAGVLRLMLFGFRFMTLTHAIGAPQVLGPGLRGVPLSKNGIEN